MIRVYTKNESGGKERGEGQVEWVEAPYLGCGEYHVCGGRDKEGYWWGVVVSQLSTMKRKDDSTYLQITKRGEYNVDINGSRLFTSFHPIVDGIFKVDTEINSIKLCLEGWVSSVNLRIFQTDEKPIVARIDNMYQSEVDDKKTWPEADRARADLGFRTKA